MKAVLNLSSSSLISNSQSNSNLSLCTSHQANLLMANSNLMGKCLQDNTLLDSVQSPNNSTLLEVGKCQEDGVSLSNSIDHLGQEVNTLITSKLDLIE